MPLLYCFDGWHSYTCRAATVLSGAPQAAGCDGAVANAPLKGPANAPAWVPNVVTHVCSQAIFASSIPEIIDLVGSRSKYGGEYKREHGKRYTNTN